LQEVSKEDVLELERFVLDNPELDQLEAQLSVFNVFETLGIVNAEIRHSNVLAWLFDPAQNHGLDHHVLSQFLKTIVAENRDDLGNVVPVLELELLDYSQIEIRREWENLDLLIVSNSTKLPFVVAIENKVRSKEHSKQLARYAATLRRAFPNHRHLKLFLTPDGALPESDDSWIVVTYSSVVECIEFALNRSGGNLGSSVHLFIDHYLTILRRYILDNEQIQDLCRRIYAKHARALDLIFEHKPDVLSDISDHLTKWVKANSPDLILDSAGKTVVRFTHQKMDAVVPATGDGWTKSKRVLLFEFWIYYDAVALRLYVGPGPAEDRAKLIDLFKQDAGFFKRANTKPGKKWHAVWQRKILAKTELDGASFVDLEERIDRTLGTILREDLPKVVGHIAAQWKSSL
jgi:hypothetical protein